MYPNAIARTRTASSTYTRSRAVAVLDLFVGDVAAFLSRGLVSRDAATGWYRDLLDVLDMEAVQRFQLKIAVPGSSARALDYEVSDDGLIGRADESGGFASYWMPPGTTVNLVLSLRQGAPRAEEARDLLRQRGWGVGTMLDAAGAPDRSYAQDGYGFRRRIVGEWPQ